MFDSSERITVCNQRYIEMYGLSPDVVKPGCTFRELILHRQETGSFPGDVDSYHLSLLNNLARGTASQQSHLPDGRSIQIINHPLANGGWVATHEDVTEQRSAEAKIAYMAHHDERWSYFLTQPAKVDSPMQRMIHDENAETVFG